MISSIAKSQRWPVYYINSTINELRKLADGVKLCLYWCDHWHINYNYKFLFFIAFGDKDNESCVYFNWYKLVCTTKLVVLTWLEHFGIAFYFSVFYVFNYNHGAKCFFNLLIIDLGLNMLLAFKFRSPFLLVIHIRNYLF